MKTIEEILEKHERELDSHWISGLWIKREDAIEAMNEHAKQVAEAQRELDIQNAEIKQESEYIGSLIGYAMVSRVDEDSIRNNPLVTDNI